MFLVFHPVYLLLGSLSGCSLRLSQYCARFWLLFANVLSVCGKISFAQWKLELKLELKRGEFGRKGSEWLRIHAGKTLLHDFGSCISERMRWRLTGGIRKNRNWNGKQKNHLWAIECLVLYTLTGYYCVYHCCYFCYNYVLPVGPHKWGCRDCTESSTRKRSKDQNVKLTQTTEDLTRLISASTQVLGRLYLQKTIEKPYYWKISHEFAHAIIS